MKNKTLVFTTALLLIAGSVFAGSGRKAGTAGAQQLLIPVGAKMIALNGGAIGTVSGIEALYWNPAGVGMMKGNAEVMVFNGEVIGDIKNQYFAGAFNFGEVGVFSFALKSLDFGDNIVTTVQNPDGNGETFSPDYITTTVGYSNLLTDRIRVGVALNLISESIQRTNAFTFGFDAGIQYSNLANVRGLSFGVVLKNLGPAGKYDGPDLLRRATETGGDRGEQYYKIDPAEFELPSLFQIGVSYVAYINESNSIDLGVAYENNGFDVDKYRGSGEYSFNNMFFVRGSYELAPDLDEVGELYGAAFGAGFNYDLGYFSLKFDYAYRDAGIFDGLNQIGVTFGF